MPVQRFNPAPVGRPSGLVEPTVGLSGVSELRLHGVGGTTPENLLGDLAPQQVSGDRIAGFYRTADLVGRVPRRHVEAYSWGGLTSRSGSRVLWLLLFPFAIANVAGWMCAPKLHEKPWRFWLHRTIVRWAALGLTVNLLLLAALMSMDLVAYQCGGQSTCVGDRWWLSPLRAAAVADLPGRRVLEGAVVPLAVVVLLVVLTLRSLTRYEQVDPPRRIGAPTQPSRTSAAMPGRGLAHRSFWDGRVSIADLGRVHIAVALAFLAVLIAHTVHTTALEAEGTVDVRLAWLWVAALALGLAVIGAALLVLMLDPCPRRLSWLLVVAGVAAVAAAAWFAWAQPAFLQPFGPLPGMRNAANLSFLGIVAAVVLVLVPVWIGGRAKGSFIAGPFVAVALGCVVLNLVLLGVMIRLADLLTRVSFNAANAPSVAPPRPVVFVYEVIGRSTPWLTLVPLLCLLGFAVFELVAYLRAGKDETVRARIRDWYGEHPPQPTTEPRWQTSALTDEKTPPRGLAGLLDRVRGRGWEAGVARARRVAQIPRDLDKLFALVAFLGVIILIGSLVSVLVLERPPPASGWMLTAGTWIATALPLLVLVALRRGWSSLESRRRIGTLWDVLTFWPRAYHPLAPPSYAERAVPELQRRLWRLHESRGRVVLAAHSQGSVIAAAALLQPNCRPDDDIVALVTFGAPLRKLYGWAFPSYFGDAVLRQLVDGDSRTRAIVWHNYHYDTDYIGGPVFGEQPPAGQVDRPLPDPQTRWYIYGQPRPALGRHSGYWADPEMWAGVDALARLTQDSPRVNRAPFDPAALQELRASREVALRVTRLDGSTSTRRVWVVVEGDVPYIRSASGPDGGWYPQIRTGAAGTLVVPSGLEVPVDADHVDDPEVWERVSQAYRAKYPAPWPDPAQELVAGAAAATTLRLRPQAP
jgi:hypothetical protein